MEDYVQSYFSTVIGLLNQVARESGAAIHQAAQAVADAVQRDQLCLLFGSGHSALAARDACGRAGGLVPMLALEDVADGNAERIEGVAKIILGRYDLEHAGVMIVISNSGINPVPIEMALLAKEAGLMVVAITSVAHSQSVKSRHSSGKRLYEVADIVLDTHGIPGDAAIPLPGGRFKSGATSTVAGTAIVQAIVVQAAALLAERGIMPPVFISANLPEGDAHNRELVSRYRSRLARYLISSYTP